jgi:hypothetical protein
MRLVVAREQTSLTRKTVLILVINKDFNKDGSHL